MRVGLIYLYLIIFSFPLFCEDLKIELVDELGDVLEYRNIPAVYRFITDDIVFASGADEEPVLFSISNREIIRKVPVKIYKPSTGWLSATRVGYNDLPDKRILYFRFGGNNYYSLNNYALNRIEQRDEFYSLYRNTKNDWSVIPKDTGDKYFVDDPSNYDISSCSLKNGYHINFGEDTLYNYVSGEEDLSRVRIYKDDHVIIRLEDIVPDFYHSIWDGLQYDVSPNKEYVLVLGWEGISWVFGESRYPHQKVYLFKITYPSGE